MKIVIIAAEESGDRLGGAVLKALRDRAQRLEVRGIGGEHMSRAGLDSLFPMHELAVMGFLEVVPHIRHIMVRMAQLKAEIIAQRPDIVLTIDAPGFNFRLVHKLRKEAHEELKGVKFVHLVAPSVWAYKPGRAIKTARLYDALLTLLPFEPEYFTRHGLESHFIGHPILETCNFVDVQKDMPPKLAVMPGSRAGEIKRMLPLILDAVEILQSSHPELEPIFFTTQHMYEHVAQQVECRIKGAEVTCDEERRRSLLPRCSVGIIKSGTVALEPALARVPHIITYKFNPVSAWMLRRMILTKYANLVNILAGRMIIPELIQEDATAQNIAASISALLTDEQARNRQVEDAQASLAMLAHPSGRPSSHIAADIIIDMAKY